MSKKNTQQNAQQGAQQGTEQDAHQNTIKSLESKVNNLMKLLNQKSNSDNGKKKNVAQDRGNDILSKQRSEEGRKRSQERERTSIESAIKFNMTVKDFIDNNKQFMPDDISSLIEVAEGENFRNEIEKSSTIQDSILRKFFSYEDNLNELSESQKRSVANFLKLTQNERVKEVKEKWDMIFIPLIEMKQKIYKASVINRSNTSNRDDKLVQIIKEKSERKFKNK